MRLTKGILTLALFTFVSGPLTGCSTEAINSLQAIADKGNLNIGELANGNFESLSLALETQGVPDFKDGEGPHAIQKEIAESFPEATAEIQALKESQKTIIEAKRAELEEKYPDFAAKIAEQKAERDTQKADKFSELEAENPELAAELKALEGLSQEEKKAKMAEIKESYPDFNPKGNLQGKIKRGGKAIKKGMKGGNGFGQDLATDFPEVSEELKALKDSEKEAMKAKMDEILAKYPEFAAKIEELKANRPNKMSGKKGKFGKQQPADTQATS